MKVIQAKTAGFCMGVRRAMEMVLAESNKTSEPIFTYGPLIHNNQVVDLLRSKGIKEIDDIDTVRSGEIVIRAHGIPPSERLKIKKKGLKILDATCPRVAKVQALIQYYTNKGYTAVIVGDKDHAEVKGLIGYSKKTAYIIQDEKDVNDLKVSGPVLIVAQTTQNEKKFNRIVSAFKKRFNDVLAFNTICDATNQRQHEVYSFKGKVDAIVVVGGKHSGNTQRLYEVAKESGLPTFFAETDENIDEKDFYDIKTVGVTAGASTPTWMIKKIVSKLEGIQGRERKWSFLLKKFLRIIALGDIAVATGAFCLAYATSSMLNGRPDIRFPVISSLYIYAMHVLSRFLDKETYMYNDAERALFIERHGPALIFTGIAACLSALLISFKVGIAPFLVVFTLCVFGVLYCVPIIPSRLRQKIKYHRVKELPASRSLVEALAWTIAITIVPMTVANDYFCLHSVFYLSTVFLISYARALYMDILQAQGDLVVGTTTLPIILGEEKTINMIYSILGITILLLVSGIFLGIFKPLSAFLIIPVLTMGFTLFSHSKLWLPPGIISELMMEVNLFLMGILALMVS